MKNIAYIALLLFLSSCASNSPQAFKDFSASVERKYPIGSDENILINDYKEKGYQYSKRAGVIKGKTGWQELLETPVTLPSIITVPVATLTLPLWQGCGRDLYSIVWHSDKNGKIDGIFVSGGGTSCL